MKEKSRKYTISMDHCLEQILLAHDLNYAFNFLPNKKRFE